MATRCGVVPYHHCEPRYVVNRLIDMRVIITYAILVIVFVVKSEEKAMFANET